MFIAVSGRALLGRIVGSTLVALAAACADSAQPAPPLRAGVSATDDVGRVVNLAAPAERVLSLVPAGTETLFALGAGERVVGRTRYDVDPHLSHLPSVGGGLDPSLEAIVALDPDLVIAFESAGGSGIRPKIERLGIPVFAIRTQDTTDIYRNIERLGTLVGRDSAAAALVESVRRELGQIAAGVPAGPRPSVLYVASIDPPIVAGPGTFLGELIGVAGGELANLGIPERSEWPQISLEVLLRADPDVVVLPVGSDPTASIERLQREAGWRDLEAVRRERVVVVPTDLMSRPGPRIAEIAALLREKLAALPARQ